LKKKGGDVEGRKQKKLREQVKGDKPGQRDLYGSRRNITTPALASKFDCQTQKKYKGLGAKEETHNTADKQSQQSGEPLSLQQDNDKGRAGGFRRKQKTSLGKTSPTIAGESKPATYTGNGIKQ